MAAIPKELFKKIRKIQFQTTHLANDILAGAYHSAFKGKGMEFEEVREYQPGDEIRSIDWNVSARMGHPYIKNFREERELTVMLVVDISASAHFGSIGQLKSDLIAEIGAVIAFSAIKNNDKVGLILFTEEVEKYLPPKKGTRHVLRVIRELLAFKPKKRGTNIQAALSFLGSVHRRSGICFLISDFICSDFSHELSLVVKKHDLVAIGIADPYEVAFPNMNLVSLQDLETEETRLIDTSSPRVQEHFRSLAQQHLEKCHYLMKSVGAGFIAIRTDQSYLPPIRKFFKLREKKRR
jgi:uncharacterized protein (DUF58 family)